MCVFAFLAGIVLTTVVGVALLIYIGSPRKRESRATEVNAVGARADDVIEELRQESDACLRELNRILNR